MQRIVPNLWFDGNAQEAVEFYASAFPNGEIISTEYYPKTAEEGLADFQKNLAGKVLTIEFRLGDLEFVAVNAGPEFKPNASISIMVNFDPSRDAQARENLDNLWGKLIDGGKALIEIGEHPFSKRYGWVQDKYGFTWQLILTNPDGEPRPQMIPSLLFGGTAQNRAEEAINFYTKLFSDAKLGTFVPYPEDHLPVKKGSVMFADFMLAEQWFAAMDSAVEQSFSFNEALSLSVACKDQAEIDALWAKLSTVPEAEQCGWCKDAYGVSWQIVPENMQELMKRPDAFKKLMAMKKLVIADF